jgi:hypothetical protein
VRSTSLNDVKRRNNEGNIFYGISGNGRKGLWS